MTVPSAFFLALIVAMFSVGISVSGGGKSYAITPRTPEKPRKMVQNRVDQNVPRIRFNAIHHAPRAIPPLLRGTDDGLAAFYCKALKIKAFRLPYQTTYHFCTNLM